MCNKIFVKINCNIFTWPTLTETVKNLSHSFSGLWEDEMTTSVNIIPDTMGQLWTPSLVSRTSPRRSELVVVHQSAEIFPEAEFNVCKCYNLLNYLKNTVAVGSPLYTTLLCY